MARPTKLDIDSGIQGWDAKVDDNFEAILNGPLPLHIHAGDESDLTSTYAPAAYDQCSIMVDHTVQGWSLYMSDGTTWKRLVSLGAVAAITALTDSSGGSADNTVAAISGSGADAAINNNFADLTAKVNAVLTLLKNHGLAT